ncbi:hypothetical protein [Rickettsia endosymbiont of Oedothorax gibbosus]|uniref:hypothetical protein n=1 Tax=Rickettsia endosymbiont of Oedothorax gibbosus TaxID=931099 RepID=UPI002024462F|nr:hypothetical protein [Rickettsia endosymbiont of Oedothorax gibbosus]
MKYFSLSYLITFCAAASAFAERLSNNSSNFTNNTTPNNYSLNAIAEAANSPYLPVTSNKTTNKPLIKAKPSADNDWLFHQSGDHTIIIRESGFDIDIFTKEVKNNTFNKLVLLENRILAAKLRNTI